MRNKVVTIGGVLIAMAIGSRIVGVAESIGAQVEPVLKVENVSVDKNLEVTEATSDKAEHSAEVETKSSGNTTPGQATGEKATIPEATIAPEKAIPVDVPTSEQVSVDEPVFVETVDEREIRVAEKEAFLQAYEARVKLQLEELKNLRSEIVALRDSIVTKQTEDTKRLGAMYGNMKAKDAAEIMNSMPVTLVVALLDSMTDTQATAVLGALDAKLAKNVTATILARGKGVKVE